MKKLLSSLLLVLIAPSALAEETKYECESQKGERVVIEFLVDGSGTTMEVVNTGDFTKEKAERHVFPSLSPFLERDTGELMSTTHVADMTSYYVSGEKEHLLFPYVRVSIELDDKVSKVSWNLVDFGESKSFEVSCDKIGEWTSIHDVI